MKPCKKFEERISEMLFGEIPENEEHMLHIHMASCDGCMNFYLSLYETLEVDDREEFTLTKEQKVLIFEQAEKLDKPIRKLSPLWTTGVSIAASIIVSGIIILSKGNRKESAMNYDYEEKSKSVDAGAEIVVKLEELEEPALELALSVGKPEPQESEKKNYNFPVITTVKKENFETNDAALEDSDDDAPSTDGRMIGHSVSDIIISPSASASAFAEPDIAGGRSTGGGQAAKEYQKEPGEGEGLNLVLGGTVLENDKTSKSAPKLKKIDETEKDNTGFRNSEPPAFTFSGKEGKEEKDADGFISRSDKENGLKAELSLNLDNTVKYGYFQNQEIDYEKNDMKNTQYYNFSDGNVSSAGEKGFKDKREDRLWISQEDSKSQNGPEKSGKKLEFKRISGDQGSLEKVLTEDSLNSEVTAKLEEVKEKTNESERQRHEKSMDELGGNTIKGLSSSHIKVEGDLSKVEEALKQQREVEADNKFLNAKKLQGEGNVEGAKQELEKAIDTLSELSKEERVLAKKVKYQELYSSLIDKDKAKRPMLSTQAQPMSTFSIDVDTASYQMAKQMIQSGQRPVPLSIRAEEFINSFDYKYEAPKTKAFAVHSEVVNSAFHRGSKIMKIGVQGKRPGGDHRAASHFCFIVDTSGSMADKNRLPMVKKVLPMIIKQMSPGDKVSLISCGLNSRLELDYMDIQNTDHVAKRIESLNAVGATNLEASLLDGYKQILKHVKKGIYSRVILFSDGVANLGEQNANNILKKLTYAKSEGVGITVIGMGEEEYNDNFLETLADKGDGNYVYIGNSKEAQKTFEKNFAATFHTIAYNVKIQVEFDPSQVSTYRLLGYENRRLKNTDFRNDKVDAGEVGSGQSVTAIYELEMTGKPSSKPMAEVRLRYRDAVDSKMKEFSTPVLQHSYNIPFEKSSAATRLAFISGKFAEVLRDGGSSEGITMDSLLKFMRPLASETNDEDIEELKNLIEKSR